MDTWPRRVGPRSILLGQAKPGGRMAHLNPEPASSLVVIKSERIGLFLVGPVSTSIAGHRIWIQPQTRAEAHDTALLLRRAARHLEEIGKGL